MIYTLLFVFLPASMQIPCAPKLSPYSSLYPSETATLANEFWTQSLDRSLNLKNKWSTIIIGIFFILPLNLLLVTLVWSSRDEIEQFSERITNDEQINSRNLGSSSRHWLCIERRLSQDSNLNGFVNTVRKVLRREISSKWHPGIGVNFAQEIFRNIRLQKEYDTRDPTAHDSLALRFLRERSKIIEIVATRDILFVLTQSGLCVGFRRESNQKICFLNGSRDEVIRSLFYNKNNDSLITVSVYASDDFSSLKCRSTKIKYIRRGEPDAGIHLFESESLKWPGFVEFDDVNRKVLTYSAQDSIYKVFDLENYAMLYTISDINIQEVKISPGVVLVILGKSDSHIPLKILDIEDGTVVESFDYPLHLNKEVDFIELFNEKLLVKQENENLQILDVCTSGITEVSHTEFMTPSAFIFLYVKLLLLTFRKRIVAVWNFRGQLVTNFEDHLLWHQDSNTNNIYITSDQHLIVSYCISNSDNPVSGRTGSINISNVLTGKCIAKVSASNILRVEDECSDGESCSDNSCRFKKRTRSSARSSRIRSTAAEALEDITALFYDEERNEIYTGNRRGLVHLWSN